MPEASDMDLAREYARRDSEPAFTELVRRHINLVYSVALRYVGNTEDAQDVTQAVFIILAQKAAGLREKTMLTGWLYETTRFTAARLLRTRARRQAREQEAYMQSTLNAAETDNAWRQLAPQLEEAMSRLTEKERTLLALRFYENKTGAEAAAAMGIREAAAHKRAARAVEKLRAFFTRRGIALSSVAIAGAVSANSVHAAPGALAKTISTVAVAKGAAASASTLTLIKGALKIMAWTKAKTAIFIGAVAILAASTATVVVKMTFFPAINDAFFQPNYQHFQNLPRGLFALRLTHFTTPPGGLDYSGETSSPSGEHVTLTMGRNRTFEQLIAKAYGGSQPYIVFPANLPKGNFDYLCTILDSRVGEHLQTAIKRKLGYVANWEERNTDIFLLKVKTSNSPGLRPGTPSDHSVTWRNFQNRLEVRNLSLRSLADELQNSADIPILDETGLADYFDFDLDCPGTDLANRNWDAVNQALGKLGLELVPTNTPMKMLVVEKAK